MLWWFLWWLTMPLRRLMFSFMPHMGGRRGRHHYHPGGYGGYGGYYGRGYGQGWRRGEWW
jgi:hypothetical protein